MIPHMGLTDDDPVGREIRLGRTHAYRALLDAIPPLDEDLPTRKLKAIAGSVPGLGEFPPGCPFRNRCPRADDVCVTMPALVGDGHRAACWHPLT